MSRAIKCDHCEEFFESPGRPPTLRPITWGEPGHSSFKSVVVAIVINYTDLDLCLACMQWVIAEAGITIKEMATA